MASDDDFHAQMADLYAKQRLKPEPRPEGVNPEEWKNRHLVSAKVSGQAYADLMAYCRQHGYSVNTAIKQILSSYFNHGSV